jgi:hypothetical protein
MSGPEVEHQLLRSGVDLGSSGIAWSLRPTVAPTMHITQRDRQILTAVWDLGYLTTSMLALLFWGRPSSACYARLRLLHNVGFLDRFRPRVARTEGSHEWIYRMTELGWRDVVQHEDVGHAARFKPAKLTSVAYVEHDLQVNALIVHLLLLACRAAGRRVDDGLLAAAPFDVLGPRRGLVDPKVGQPAQQLDGGSTTAFTVRSELAVPGTLVPDATLLGTDARGRRTAVMVEYDRTRRPHKQISKWRRYDHFLTSGWRNTRYATLDIEPLVLFVCSDERQIPAFLRSADERLTAWHGLPSEVRADAEHPGREQTAFTSRGRLFDGDWRMLQVPSRPPAARRTTANATAFSARSVELELPRLFRHGLRRNRRHHHRIDGTELASHASQLR